MSRRLPALILSLAVFVAADAADQPTAKRSDEVREPGLPFATTVMVENTAAVAAIVNATWTLQANPPYIDQAIPDPLRGVDHALGARCTLTVDGAECGDPLLCDVAALTSPASTTPAADPLPLRRVWSLV